MPHPFTIRTHTCTPCDTHTYTHLCVCVCTFTDTDTRCVISSSIPAHCSLLPPYGHHIQRLARFQWHCLQIHVWHWFSRLSGSRILVALYVEATLTLHPHLSSSLSSSLHHWTPMKEPHCSTLSVCGLFSLWILSSSSLSLSWSYTMCSALFSVSPSDFLVVLWIIMWHLVFGGFPCPC